MMCRMKVETYLIVSKCCQMKRHFLRPKRVKKSLKDFLIRGNDRDFRLKKSPLITFISKRKKKIEINRDQIV